MGFLSSLLHKFTGFFMYTPPTSPVENLPPDRVYDQDLLLNVDHEVVNVGEKLQQIEKANADLNVQAADLAQDVASVKYVPASIAELGSYNKTQDAQIETIKAAEFDSANEIKNLIEKQESMKADLTGLRDEVNNLKLPIRQTTGNATLSSGRAEIQISNPYVESTSTIFVTLTTQADINLAVTSKSSDHTFTVTASSTPSQDINFDYWIVNETKD